MPPLQGLRDVKLRMGEQRCSLSAAFRTSHDIISQGLNAVAKGKKEKEESERIQDRVG